MNCRERVLVTINHEEPDRVPFEIDPFGAYSSAWTKIASLLGVSVEEARSLDDVRGDFPPETGYEPELKRARKVLDDGQYIDEWGILRNPTYKGGGSIDWFVEHPIKEPEDLDIFKFPDPYAPGRFDKLDELIDRYGDSYPIFFPVGWGLFERAWTLHGFSDVLKDLYLRPDFMEKLLDGITEFNIGLATQVIERQIDIFGFFDDYGSQQGLIINVSLWRKFMKPRLKKILDIPRKKGLPIFFHTDGNVSGIIPDLIDVGVSILNPVQPLAIDPAWVKEKFGDSLCLYGTIDLQHTLPFGSPKDVEKEVLTRIRTAGVGGGLILSPSHSLTADVSAENLMAFCNAVRQYGRYPLRQM